MLAMSPQRMAVAVALAMCVTLTASVREAAAQPKRTLGKTENRDLAKGCGRTSSWTDCARSGLDWIADLVLAELQAAPLPAENAGSRKSTPRVVWDGTFAHPAAPNFYTLKRLVPAGAPTSEEACAQLPGAVKTDRQLLLKLTCQAEEELLAEGPNRWPEELGELRQIRTLFLSCLPPQASSANPCAAP
jgi:hypothetical protein